MRAISLISSPLPPRLKKKGEDTFWQDQTSAERGERERGEKKVLGWVEAGREEEGGRAGKLRKRFCSDSVPTSHLSFL